MLELRISIEKSYRVWGEFFTESTVDGWVDIFAATSEAVAIDVWQKLSVSRIPNPLEVRAAIAGIDPHQDWRAMVAVAAGRATSAMVAIACYSALAEIGGIGPLRSADSREAERLRAAYWQALDFSLGAEPVELRLSEHQGGVHLAQTLPVLPPSTGSAEMDFSQALAAVVGWEDRPYPTSTGRLAQQAKALANVLRAGKIPPDLAANQMTGWPNEVKDFVWHKAGVQPCAPRSVARDAKILNISRLRQINAKKIVNHNKSNK
jgi:hypothetical protein